MSLYNIVFVPDLPDFVPAAAQERAAFDLLRDHVGDSDLIGRICNDKVCFFDCGERFQRVSCPFCKAELDVGWWGDIMSRDYGSAPKVRGTLLQNLLELLGRAAPRQPLPQRGFRLEAYPLPCCGRAARLNELHYEGGQAFGRFALTVQDQRRGPVEARIVHSLGRALGCGIIVVYQHY